MSREAELLRTIGAIADEAFRARSAAGTYRGVGQLAAEAAHAAAAMEMDQTWRVATELASLAQELEARPGEARTAAALENCVDTLQFTADSELERRLCAGGEKTLLLPGGGELGNAALRSTGVDVSLLPDFIAESREHLEAVEKELLQLEREPANAELLHAVFRAFHTLKGLAGVGGLETVRDVAHEVETVLELVRAGSLEVTPALIGVVLDSADYLALLIGAAESQLRGQTPDRLPAPAQLMGSLRSLRTGSASPAAPPLPDRAAAPAPGGVRRERSAAVKVNTANLDQLVDMVGELVIAHSLVQQDATLELPGQARLARNLAQLGRITKALQKSAMQLRVVPIGAMFQRMARIFRELTVKTGKEAVLQIEGEDAELDRTIVERLAEPLLHMIRNAVDHGVETPAQRMSCGKPRQAKVRLAATHQAGHIEIEVSDDGCGLDSDRILERARQRGLIDAGAAPLTAEIHELLFLPGFSTAETVSDMSGRGVGLDIVRRQIHQLRGHIEIRSEPGRGTTFLLRLPLTLAIIDALIVRLGGDRYLLPVFAVREIYQPGESGLMTIEGKQEVALLRGALLPVLRLGKLLGQQAPGADGNAGRLPGDTEAAMLVVVDVEGRRYGIAVDEVLGKQEIVIKSLGLWLGAVPGVSGAAILGDGTVGIILDPKALIEGRMPPRCA